MCIVTQLKRKISNKSWLGLAWFFWKKNYYDNNNNNKNEQTNKTGELEMMSISINEETFTFQLPSLAHEPL